MHVWSRYHEKQEFSNWHEDTDNKTWSIEKTTTITEYDGDYNEAEGTQNTKEI